MGPPLRYSLNFHLTKRPAECLVTTGFITPPLLNLQPFRIFPRLIQNSYRNPSSSINQRRTPHEVLNIKNRFLIAKIIIGIQKFVGSSQMQNTCARFIGVLELKLTLVTFACRWLRIPEYVVSNIAFTLSILYTQNIRS